MLAAGLVICLSARPETIYRRISDRSPVPNSQGGRPERPLLAGDDPMERIRELLAQRADAYAQAHHTIETDSLAPQQVARRILALYQIRAAAGEE